MLALGIRGLNDEIDETSRNSDELRRNGAAADELLRLADDEAMRVMRRLGNRQRIEGNRLFFHGAIAVGVNRAGAKNPDVDREAAIEHEILIVNALNRDIVRRVITGGLIDFAAFDSRIDERPEADARQVSGPARGNGSKERRALALRQADGLCEALAQEGPPPGAQDP